MRGLVQPAADQHLLLVAAREILDALLQVRRLDPKLAAHLLAGGSDFPLADEAALDEFVLQHGDLHVFENVEDEQTAGVLAILGEKRHPVTDRLVGAVDHDLFPVDRDRARARRRDPEERLGDVGAAGSDEAGNAEDLAGAHIEGDVVEDAVERQVLHRQHHVADRHLLLREHLGDFTSDHHADDVVAGDLVREVGADIFAVAEHRELVGDLEQLVHLVGDVDDADTLRAQVTDDLE